MNKIAQSALAQIKPAVMLLILLTGLTGGFYPFVVTVVAQIFLPDQANGSLMTQNGVTIGSKLIGQSFTSPSYFWGRPSATMPFSYNSAASSASHYGPSNLVYLEQLKQRAILLQQASPTQHELMPVDLLTASASGLDPEISPFAAFYQVSRIARARGLSEVALNALIQRQIVPRTFGLLGEPRVNVLKLNLALDNLRISHGSSKA